jgi:hypothetical protein
MKVSGRSLLPGVSLKGALQFGISGQLPLSLTVQCHFPLPRTSDVKTPMATMEAQTIQVIWKA